MGAWKELDTQISVKNDFTDLDTLLSLKDNYGIFEPLQEIVKDIKSSITKGTKRGVYELSLKNRSFQEKWINKNCKNPSGMLASSINITGSDYSFTIGTIINHIYPMSIEYGHGDIYPIKAKALAFYTDSGELIFRKHVNPTKPRPFVAPAYDDTDKIVEDIMVTEIGHAGIQWD